MHYFESRPRSLAQVSCLVSRSSPGMGHLGHLTKSTLRREAGKALEAAVSVMFFQ